MANTKNKEIVTNLKDKLENAKSIVFMDYTGLDANNLSELRKQIRAEGAELSIAKNTLMKLALTLSEKEKEKAGKPSAKLVEQLKGQVMALLSYEDAITPLKKLVEFAKARGVPVVKMGIFDGKMVSAAKIVELSDLPSKEELIARVVWGLKAPLSGITNVLGGTQRKFVYALSAIADKKVGE